MQDIEKLRKLKEELTLYYTDLDGKNQSDELIACQKSLFAARGEKKPPELKTDVMHILAEKSRVKVFRFHPFYHEFTAGRLRYNWGGLNECSQFMIRTLGAELLQEFDRTFVKDREEGYIRNWDNPVGLDHHCLNYDYILNYGLSGLLSKAERLKKEASCEKAAFYDSAIEALRVLMKLSLRFSAEAERMLLSETDGEARENLGRIAKCARALTERAPETFYEALASIVFCRECVGTLEGIGISTYGQLDRTLYPFYEKDLRAGRITPEEAKTLFMKLFLYTGVRFNEENEYHETSTTVILGGQDMLGNTVCNEVTRLILDALSELRCCSVKFDCRISKKHPQWYIDKLCEIVLSGLPVLVFMNDDVHVPARVKHGQKAADARLYTAGGCHEYVLGGTEVCSRADNWINITRILMDTLEKREYPDFDTLLSEAIADVRRYHEKVAEAKNKTEVHWSEIDPMPLYSTMMADCLEKGLDVTAGGARYNSTALSMLGPANFIDTLNTVRKLCFEEKKFTVAELLHEMQGDHAEELRQYIVNRLPKYGTGDAETDALTVKVLRMLGTVSGRKNGRGGYYYPAFYAHDQYHNLGSHTMATPDGRKDGWDLSRGCSASEFVKGITPLHMLHSTEKIDFTDFTDSFALELTLPKMSAEKGLPVFREIVDGFLRAEGSTLQINSYDVDMLRDADIRPEAHRDLIVRVCGYSAAFVTLNPDMRRSIIARESRL